MLKTYIAGNFRCVPLNASLSPQACAAMYRKWNAPNRVPQSGCINSDCTNCAVGYAHDKLHPAAIEKPIVYKLRNGEQRALKSFDKRLCKCGKWFQPQARHQKYCSINCPERKHKLMHGVPEPEAAQ